MKVSPAALQKLITLRLNPGDDILLSIREAVKSEHIENALILEGVGSCASSSYHVVASQGLPPKELYPSTDLPADIININGMVIDGRVHAHITFANERVAYGGHLEEGTHVLTFTVIVLAVIDEHLTNYDNYKSHF